MCRNIRTLFNYAPPATEEEIEAAALQYVRKISGYRKPSATNEDAFNQAVEEIAKVSARLLQQLITNSPPKDRDEERAKAIARNKKRFG